MRYDKEKSLIFGEILRGISAAANSFMDLAADTVDDDGELPEDLVPLESLIMNIEDIVLDYGDEYLCRN